MHVTAFQERFVAYSNLTCVLSKTETQELKHVYFSETTMSMELSQGLSRKDASRSQGELRAVSQGGPEWDTFLSWSVDYILTYWPTADEGKGREAFSAEYAEYLKSRVAEGGRGLFLLSAHGKDVGIANVYLDERMLPGNPRAEKSLHISEYSILPEFRKLGHGTRFLEPLKAWGLGCGAIGLVVEVDKGLEPANSFWSSLGLSLDTTGTRNVYYSKNLNSFVPPLR
jgi:GNAT superfamily N-acetyltransferase